MAGKDEIANAVLGGGSDYIADIAAGFTKIFLASGEERVSIYKDFKSVVEIERGRMYVN